MKKIILTAAIIMSSTISFSNNLPNIQKETAGKTNNTEKNSEMDNIIGEWRNYWTFIKITKQGNDYYIQKADMDKDYFYNQVVTTKKFSNAPAFVQKIENHSVFEGLTPVIISKPEKLTLDKNGFYTFEYDDKSQKNNKIYWGLSKYSQDDYNYDRLGEYGEYRPGEKEFYKGLKVGEVVLKDYFDDENRTFTRWNYRPLNDKDREILKTLTIINQ